MYRTQCSADCYEIIEAVSVDAIPRADVEFDVLDAGVGTLYVHSSVREYLSSSTLQPGDELFVPASHLLLWECHQKK